MDILKKNIPTNDHVPIGGILIKKDDKYWMNQEFLMEWNGANSIDHCELLLLQKAEILGWDLSKCIIIVTCEPCVMCFGALSLSKISSIIFGCYNEKFGFMSGGFNLLNNGLYTPTIIGGIEEEFWRDLLIKFFKKIRK